MAPKVLVSDKLSETAVQIFRDRGIDVTFDPSIGKDKDKLLEVIGDYDGLAIRSATKVTAKVLVFNGADDPFVKPESISAFKSEMRQAGVDFTFVSMPGAKHSFTNPGSTAVGKTFELPLEYNAEADNSSWKQMQDFFDSLFK